MPQLSKTEARRYARRRWKEFLRTPGQSERLLGRLEEWLDFEPRFRRILCTIPLSYEIDTLSVLLSYAKRHGSELYAPRTHSQGCMEFRLLVGDSEQEVLIEQGYQGIPGPPAEARLLAFPLDKKDLVLLPGLACNPRRIRLGQGGGYYDRLRDELSLARSCMVVPESLSSLDFIAESHDMQVEVVVTEKERVGP